MALFGRKPDDVLTLQRATIAQFMRTVGELEDRIRSTEALKAKYADVWQHDDSIAQYRRSLELIRGIADAQSTRLKMTSSAIPSFDTPLLAALDRIDAIFVSMDDLVLDLTLRRAAANAGHGDFARAVRPQAEVRAAEAGNDADEEETGRTPASAEGEVIVWVSRAMKHASNLRPITSEVSQKDLHRAVEWKRRNEDGEALDVSYFPAEVFGAPHSDEKDYELPDIFRAGSFWIVSKAAADVLRQFDLGHGSLYPVRVLKKDRRTAIGDNWSCLNFGNRKSAVLPEQSEKIRMGPQNRYNLPATTKDNQVTVSAEALQGPDMWVDPQLWDNFFVSAALGRALRKAKADKGLFLTKCRVL
jgi:hypothetical protein